MKHFSNAELSTLVTLANMIAKSASLPFGNTNFGCSAPPAPPKNNGRVEVVYIAGCFKEAQNIKRWLDVNSGTLHNTMCCDRVANSGFVAAGAHNARPIYVNNQGDTVRFMQQTTLDGTPAATRIPVKYECGKYVGTFLLDVDTGVLYSADGTTQGTGYKRNVYGNYTGRNHYTVVPVQLPAQETKVAVTYVVGTFAFNKEYAAIQHAKHMAIVYPGKEFIVDTVTTTKVVTKSKPYKVTETAQVKTVQTKSWE